MVYIRFLTVETGKRLTKDGRRLKEKKVVRNFGVKMNFFPKRGHLVRETFFPSPLKLGAKSPPMAIMHKFKNSMIRTSFDY